MSEMSVLHESHKNVHQIYKGVASEEKYSLENAHGDSPVCLPAVFPVDSLS